MPRLRVHDVHARDDRTVALVIRVQIPRRVRVWRCNNPRCAATPWHVVAAGQRLVSVHDSHAAAISAATNPGRPL